MSSKAFNFCSENADKNKQFVKTIKRRSDLESATKDKETFDNDSGKETIIFRSTDSILPKYAPLNELEELVHNHAKLLRDQERLQSQQRDMQVEKERLERKLSRNAQLQQELSKKIQDNIKDMQNILNKLSGNCANSDNESEEIDVVTVTPDLSKLSITDKESVPVEPKISTPELLAEALVELP